MRHLEKKYTPVYTPRFRLADGSLVGIEVRVKCGHKCVSDFDAFKLVQAGDGGSLLEQIAGHLSKWSESAGHGLYVSWGVGGTANRAELALFLDELSRALPLPQVEIVVEVDNLLASGAMDNCLGLFDGLSGKGVRRGLLHANQFGFVLDELRPSVADELCASIDMLKLRRVAIVEMKDDIGLASLGHSFIESLNAQAVDIVADELYNRSDVALAILLGIRYGQGFFLSRNETQQKIGKAMRKQPGADFFERRFEPSFCY